MVSATRKKSGNWLKIQEEALAEKEMTWSAMDSLTLTPQTQSSRALPHSPAAAGLARSPRSHESPPDFGVRQCSLSCLQRHDRHLLISLLVIGLAGCSTNCPPQAITPLPGVDQEAARKGLRDADLAFGKVSEKKGVAQAFY